MLLGNNDNLENTLLLALSENKVATVSQVLEELKRRKLKPTIQGIYRVLRKLQIEGIVVKERENYTIRIPWILDLGDFVKNVEDKYLKSAYFKNLIPKKEKEKLSWNFTSIFKLNDFWSQLAIVLIENSKEKILLNYHPHPWFYLIQSHQEYQYIKTSSEYLKKRYTVIGGREYLDNWAIQFWQRLNIEYFLAPREKWLTQDRTKNISIIDDCLLIIKYDKNIADEIDSLYKKVKGPDQLNAQEVLSVFQTRIKGKIILQKNAKTTNLYKKKFEKLFGQIYKS